MKIQRKKQIFFLYVRNQLRKITMKNTSHMKLKYKEFLCQLKEFLIGWKSKKNNLFLL